MSRKTALVVDDSTSLRKLVAFTLTQAGFDVLECADLDEAIEVARRHPMARLGVLEVRPFWPFEED